MKTRRLDWSRASFALVAFAVSAQASSDRSAFSKRLSQYSENAQTILDEWDNARPELDSEHGKAEAARYYQDILNFYVKQPLAEHIDDVDAAFATYSSDVNKLYVASGIEADLNSCSTNPLSKNKLKGYGQTVTEQMRQLAVGGTIRGVGRSARSRDDFSSRDLNDAIDAALDSSAPDSTFQCCKQGRKDAGDSPEDAKKFCEKLLGDLQEAQARFKAELNTALPPPADAPDPGSVFDGDYQLFGYFLQEHRYLKSDLSKARRSGGHDLEASADAETEVLENIKSACERGVAKAQDKSKPISKSLITNLGKAIKCHLLPAVATTSWDLQWQRLAVGGASVPVEGKDWDVDCDPNETAQYLAMRTDDPNQLAKQWGLDSLQNPDYIMRLRNLQPSASVSIVPNPTGGYFTGLGVYGVPQTGTSSIASGLRSANGMPYSAGNTGRGVGVMTGSGNSNGSRRLSSSRLSTAGVGSGGGVRTLAARTASSSSRIAVSNGVARATQVRAVGAAIHNNQNPVQLASALQSGAAKTRSFAATVAANNASLSGSQRRSISTQSALQAKSVVTRLAGVRGSQSTAQDILNAVTSGNGNPGTLVGNLNKPTPEQVNAAQAAQQKQIDLLITQAINSIYDKQQKQRQKISEIQSLINERDVLIAATMAEIIDKAPKKQAERVQQLRLELMQKDKEISLLKVEYDGYDAAILQQNVIAQSLQYGGTTSPYYRGGPGSGGGSSRGKTNGVYQPILDLLFPVAWAEPTQSLDFIGAFQAFIKDLRQQVADRKVEEKKLRQEAYRMYKARGESITAANARDYDSGAIIEASLYADALYAESKDLVESASDDRSPSSIAPNVVSLLVQTRDDANEARKSLDTIALQFKESYPLKADENGEAWWSLVPGAILE